MHPFLTSFAALVWGVLSGFERLFFSGTLRRVSYCLGLPNYLWARRIPFKDFAAHSLAITARREETSLRPARELGRAIRSLNSAQHSQEDRARAMAARDRLRDGLICVLRRVDPCRSFRINKNHQTRELEIRYRQRTCLHLYPYQMHPVFGFRHARMQTWFPGRVWVCLHGRDWLARQLDQAKLPSVRRANTFTGLEDVAAAQALFDQQREATWPRVLGGLAQALNPVPEEILAAFPCQYYGTGCASAWASAVLFRTRAALPAVSPRLLRSALNPFAAVAVLRFLGQPVPARGQVPHRCRHEVSSTVQERREGLRIQHWLTGNSLKRDDQTSALRLEALIGAPPDFKV
jgi:hypothetical protein